MFKGTSAAHRSSPTEPDRQVRIQIVIRPACKSQRAEKGLGCWFLSVPCTVQTRYPGGPGSRVKEQTTLKWPPTSL